MPTSVEIFEQIIRQQSVQELMPFLLELAKNDVVAVREKTRRLQRELSEHRQLGNVTWGQAGTNAQLEMLFLAGLSTYSRKEALAAPFANELWRLNSSLFFNAENGFLPPNELFDFTCQLLTHRRPDWLDTWLGNTSGNSAAANLDFAMLLKLEHGKLVALAPRTLALSGVGALVKYGTEATMLRQLHRYTNSATAHTASQASSFIQLKKAFTWLQEGEEVPAAEDLIYERIARNKDLLERAIPAFFEFDTQLDWAIAHLVEHRNTKRITWHHMLVRLAASGHLNRADILTRCLLALRRDFRRPLLTWFKELFVSLKPTTTERLARQSDLVELLTHPLPLVVNFAIEQLKNVWLEPGFDLAPLLLYAGNLLTRPDLKTGLNTLLTGLGKLARQHAAQASAVAQLLAAALAHPNQAVQERAAKGLAELLDSKKTLLSKTDAPAIVAALGSQADLLGAAARAVLAPWLPTLAVADVPAAAAVTYVPSHQFVPDISPATAIVPVADWPELLFLTGQVLRHDNPAALERWLDGLLQLHGQLPAGHADQLLPYVQQVLPELKKATPAEATTFLAGPIQIWGHDGLAEALLLSWVNGFRTPRVQTVEVQGQHLARTPLLALEQQRYAQAEGLLWHKLALPLLSTPTHTPHWIAPSALITKLLAYEAGGHEPAVADLALALARTAHAHPAEAAAARLLLPQLQHAGLRELLTWFLSAELIPLPTPASPAGPARQAATPSATLADALPELWAVAARTKAPAQTFPTLPAWLGYDYAGVSQPLHPAPEISAQENVYQESHKPGQPATAHRWTEMQWRSASAGPAPSALLLYSPPPSQSKDASWEHNQLLVSNFSYLAALLPHYAAPLYEYTLRCAAWADNLEASERDLVAQALRALLLPGPLFAPAATILLASGLIHHAPLCRALAQEVLLQAIANGRLLPGQLSEVLGQQLTVGYAPVQRLADNLAPLGGIDALTDDALTQLLEALLPTLPAAPLRNLRKLLELYADLAACCGRAVPATVQARLREWQAAASLKKLATALLAPTAVAAIARISTSHPVDLVAESGR